MILLDRADFMTHYVGQRQIWHTGKKTLMIWNTANSSTLTCNNAVFPEFFFLLSCIQGCYIGKSHF